MKLTLDKFVYNEMDGTRRLLFENADSYLYVWIDDGHAFRAMQFIFDETAGAYMTVGRPLRKGVISGCPMNRTIKEERGDAGALAVMIGAIETDVLTEMTATLKRAAAAGEGAAFRLSGSEAAYIDGLPHSRRYATAQMPS